MEELEKLLKLLGLKKGNAFRRADAELSKTEDSNYGDQILDNLLDKYGKFSFIGSGDFEASDIDLVLSELIDVIKKKPEYFENFQGMTYCYSDADAIKNDAVNAVKRFLAKK